MRIIVTIQHPGHVHFFKHAVTEFEDEGHEVFVFARENEMTSALLRSYDIDHEVLVGESRSFWTLPAIQAVYETRLLRRARVIDPDVIAGIGGVAAAHVASILDTKSVVFYDTEHATIIKKLAYPFADVICTPSCYAETIGPKQVRYPGYHELAYLHPNRFEPDPSVLSAFDLEPDDPFAIVRFNGWDSSHDVGQGGFDDMYEVVDRIERTGTRVLLTSEMELPVDLERYTFTPAADRIHDLLAFADVVVGEGATTAAEAAVLGTPSIYVNTLTMSYTNELESRYGLLFNHNGPTRQEQAIVKAVSILEAGEHELWKRRRQRMLAEKIDVTRVIRRQVEAAVRPELTKPVPSPAHAQT